MSPSRDDLASFTVAVLETAAGLVDAHGWAGPGPPSGSAQERWDAREAGQLSVFDAISKAELQLIRCHSPEMPTAVMDAALKAFLRVAPPPQPGPDPDRLPEWDIINWECGVPQRTAAEVAATLREAAHMAHAATARGRRRSKPALQWKVVRRPWWGAERWRSTDGRWRIASIKVDRERWRSADGRIKYLKLDQRRRKWFVYKRRGRFSFDFATTTEFVSPEAAARSLERGESPEEAVQILAWEFIYGPLPTQE